MAYRRRQPISRATTVIEEPPSSPSSASCEDPSSLATRAIRASAAHRDPSDSRLKSRASPTPDSVAGDFASNGGLDERKNGFWGILARKAKAMLEDDNAGEQFESLGGNQGQMDATSTSTSTNDQFPQSRWSNMSSQRIESPSVDRTADALTSSLDKFGGTLRNALEEGLTIVENKAAETIHKTKKLQIRRKENGLCTLNEAADGFVQGNLPQIQSEHEAQLKASRDVANTMAAKAKLVLRELKTVNADLAFAKQRCTQLEEENKLLRESREKGVRHEDDDLIRLQLETLLSEKARLAHENSVYARENRFLREIVEYHQPTMQDVVYLDEDMEDDTELCSSQATSPSSSPTANRSPTEAIAILRSPMSPTLSPTSRSHRAASSMVSPEACPTDSTLSAAPTSEREEEPSQCIGVRSAVTQHGHAEQQGSSSLSS